MNSYKISTLLVTLLLVTACGSDSNSDAGPEAITHQVDIIAVDVVNKDSGQPIDTDGLPVVGDILVVQ